MKTKSKLLLLILGLICIDFFTKIVFQHKNVTLIPHLFYLKYSENPGLIFGFFSYNMFFNYMLPLLVLIFLGIYFYKNKNPQEQLALSFLIAGIFGNLFSRAMHGYVIDWAYIPIYPPLNMANFNLADTFIITGVIFIILLSFKKK